MPTITGRRIDLIDFENVSISAIDVAFSLGRQGRYLGHLKKFYSVAEHTVRMVRLLRANGYKNEVQRHGLFHDGPETFTGDIVRPIKTMEGIKLHLDSIEARLDFLFANRFRLVKSSKVVSNGRCKVTIHDAIKHYDSAMIILEAEALYINSKEIHTYREGSDSKYDDVMNSAEARKMLTVERGWWGWSHEVATMAWMAEYNRLYFNANTASKSINDAGRVAGCFAMANMAKMIDIMTTGCIGHENFEEEFNNE